MLINDDIRILAEYTGSALAVGPILASTINTGDAAAQVHWLGQTSAGGTRNRGVTIIAASTAANDTTAACVIWALHVVRGAKHAADSYTLRKVGTLTATFGTKMGVGTVLDSTYRIADGMSWSGAAWATALTSALAATFTVHNPADNTQGELIMSDLGGAIGLLFEADNACILGVEAFT